MSRLLPALFAALFLAGIAPAASGASRLEQIGEFMIPEAYQGIGVDDRYFYAVHNQVIAKYDKKTGKPAGKWEGPKEGPIAHLDSAMVMDGKIFAAHSNYPEWPMTSSLEIYKMRLPKAGSVLELVETIPMNIRGQGIAWDRSDRGVLYGIIRATSKERASGVSNKVTVFRLIDIP